GQRDHDGHRPNQYQHTTSPESSLRYNVLGTASSYTLALEAKQPSNGRFAQDPHPESTILVRRSSREKGAGFSGWSCAARSDRATTLTTRVGYILTYKKGNNTVTSNILGSPSLLMMVDSYAAPSTRCRSRSNFARPYMCRLICFNRFTWP